MKHLLRGTIAAVVLCLSACSGATPAPSVTSTPVPVPTSATPTVSASSGPGVGAVELTPPSAAAQAQVYVDCSPAGTATYSMYTKDFVYLTVVEKSPDCYAKPSPTPTTSATSTLPTDPYTHWVVINPLSDKDRWQTVVFCSAQHTGFYWIVNTDKKSPFDGATVVAGYVTPNSAECK